MIHVPELIERKRDGGELDAAEMEELMLGYARDEIPDYQLAAFCMAVMFRGLTSAETYAMTDALIRTGDTVDLHGALGRKVVDTDDHALAQRSKSLRQALEHLMRHGFHFGERGGFCFGPHQDVFSVCYARAHPGFAS